MESLWEEFSGAPLTSDERAYLEENSELKSDAAFQGLPEFGTGGMRAITGIGSRRLNRYNIARLVLAIREFLNHESSNPLIVIAYDSRLTSVEFTNLSYHLFKNSGARCLCFKRPTPTPLLSYAVRELKADCGIVITASHNPRVQWLQGVCK